MVLPSQIVPARATWVARQIEELRRELREGMASVARSFSPQVSFLLGQTVAAEVAPGAITTIVIDPATSDVPLTWLPFDPAADAVVALTTSSTGRIAVQAGGFIGLYSANFSYAYGYIGVEILDGTGTQVRPPYDGDGNLSTVWGERNFQVNANSGHRHEWTLSPDTSYTLRCRRGYQVGAGNAGAEARVGFQGTALDVTKIGM